MSRPIRDGQPAPTRRGWGAWRRCGRPGGRPQPETLLGVVTGFTDPVEVVPDPGPPAVLARERRHDMNVISGMPDRYPSDAELVVLGCEPGSLHDPGRDLRPLRVRQHPVPRRGPDGTMPDRLVVPRPGQRGQRLRQQPGQTAEIRRAVPAVIRLKFAGIGESGDQMRIYVLVRLPGPVKVIKQLPGVCSADHLPDHGMPAAPSQHSAAQLFRGLIQPPDHPHAKPRGRKQILTTLPSRIQLSDGLVQVRSSPAYQPGGGHQFDQGLSQR